MLKETVEWCKPTRATKYSAMVDLYAKEDVVIGAGETRIVNLGVKIDIENSNVYKTGDYEFALKKGGNKPLLDAIKKEAISDFKREHFLSLHPRSSLRAKGLIVGVGVIDLDYPDELGLIVHNPIIAIPMCSLEGGYTIGYPIYPIKKGDKIAQCTLIEHKGYLLGIESDVERSGGFGSTDNAK